MREAINITIIPNKPGEPVVIRIDGGSVTAQTDEAMYATAALSAMAYHFAQGQPPKFGPEVPLEVLR